MKLLLDACVWGPARAEIEAAGHEVVWAGDWPENPGDSEILERAFSSGSTLIRLDKDFGELTIVRQQPHFDIIRLVDCPARRQATVSVEVLSRYGTELQAGAIVTAEPGRIRFRPPPGREI